eukprot:scaffold3225_cov105-Isochrysis_galbana.AAC.2
MPSPPHTPPAPARLNATDWAGAKIGPGAKIKLSATTDPGVITIPGRPSAALGRSAVPLPRAESQTPHRLLEPPPQRHSAHRCHE